MTTDNIRQKLEAAFQPDLIEIIDQSAAHAGHAGNQGGGHFYVTLVSTAFDGKSLVQRHQLVYQALGDMMKDEIHALGINALTPTENSKGNS
ncbi:MULTISPECIES: BolA family protein [unclassified Methylomonas]|uniref:BolA family protein n=1 Tax=unclassified Methylomonas TaxID=2608980 RepID=UPI0008DA9F4A|nr:MULTISPECIES: BolA family protein [unclassified Methylomonas]NJA07295.1 BolA family transcriptional regulator [Methylococcaceae bacterium WWC4]OHX34544.1 BolA family transcriptional regulator [Methylomonas sp. LWB]WGS85188.1 BolA family protein [Methylomonas sp. UP202]